MEAILSLDAETRSMVESSLDRFVDEAYEPTQRHARLKAAQLDYRANWATLAELGVLALSVPEALGGIGGSSADVSNAVRILARGLVLEPLIEAGIAPMPLFAAAQAAVPAAATAFNQALSGEQLTVLVGGRRDDRLLVEQVDGGLRLSGLARVVPGAAQAEHWLVAAALADGTDLLLSLRSAGLPLSVYRLMDGRQAGDIHFDGQRLALDSVWLRGAPATQALQAAAARAISAYCADASGVMACLVRQTGDYLRTRVQFDVPLASFQALQHRLADMHMAALEARSMARAIARSIDTHDAGQLRWLSYAAPTVIARCATRVGHDAIQLHGGMGVTDELIISHYNSRLVVLQQLLARWMSPAAANPLS